MNQMTRRTPRWLQSDVFGGPETRFLVPVSRLHQEMNRLFSDAFRGLDEGGEQGEGWTFNPVVDVEQQDRQYEITVELPGVSMNDINVEMQEDLLVISGSKERKKTSGQGEQQRSERVYGSFQRRFSLPEDAQEDGISARFADGVLVVTIPRDQKQARVSSRRIDVQQGSSPAGDRERGEQIEHQEQTGKGNGDQKSAPASR